MDTSIEDADIYVDLIVDLFFPLIAAVEDPNRASRLLVDLGYFPPSAVTAFSTLSPALKDLQDLIVTLEEASASGDNDKMGEALLDILGLAAEIFRAVNAISTTLQDNFASSGLLTDTDILATISLKLTDYLVVRFLEDRHPVVHSALLLVGIIELEEVGDTPTEFHAPHLRRTVRWDHIPAYFSDPLNTLTANLVDAQELRYRPLVYFLYMLGAGIGYYSSFVRPDLEALGTFNDSHDLSPLLPPPDTGPVYDGESITPYTDIHPLASLSLPLTTDPAAVLGLVFYPVVDPFSKQCTGVGMGVRFGGELQIPLGDTCQILIKFSSTLSDSLGLRLDTSGKFTFINQLFTDNPEKLTEAIQFGARISIAPMAASAQPPLFSLGVLQGSRFEIGSGSLALGIEKLGELSLFVEADLTDGLIVLRSDEADGFLSQILPAEGIRTDFSVGVGFSNRAGMYFKGSSSLVVRLPIHVALGPVNVENLTIALTFENGRFPLTLATGISVKLGPITAVVEEVGVSATFAIKADRSGNMGPLNVDFGFKPPNGVGLAINTGVVKGGGYLYFNFEKEEYAGVLELTINKVISLKAIGLITTRMPDGSKGFSLLIIITAEFGSPVQLGFGFTLSGVGGLLGLNRTMLLQPLAEGVRTGAINSVMFPTEVVANASRIISDLQSFFPVHEGIFLIGPMAKLGWGTPNLVTLSLGIIIEIPGNIAILGVLKVVLPDEKKALLVLQANFIGAIEFDKKRAWFFASIFESRILFITIEGEIGVLVAWGDDPNFVISVGGFHPVFKAPPLPFPEPRRVTLCILNTSYARIRAETYLAVTSNTVQFGANVEFFFGFDAIKVEGQFVFDALFRSPPFYFIITLSATLSVQVAGTGLFSIRFRGSLEGTTPWRIAGTGTISLLFFNIPVNIDHTWGEEIDTFLPPILVGPLLVAELEKLENWKTRLPASNNLSVSLRKIDMDKVLLLHPIGTLQISQRAIPLDLQLDKVGNQKPEGTNNFTVSVSSTGLSKKGDLDESFAMGQFKDMDDANKLSSPAFEKWKAGIELSADAVQTKTSLAVKRVVRYEKIIIDTNYKRAVEPLFVLFANLFTLFLGGNAVTKSTLSQQYLIQKQPFADKVAIQPDLWVVASNADNSALAGTAGTFTSQAKAHEYMQQQVKERPDLAENVHVIPKTEVRRAAA